MFPCDWGRNLPQVGDDRRYTSHQNRDSGISNDAPPRWQSQAPVQESHLCAQTDRREDWITAGLGNRWQKTYHNDGKKVQRSIHVNFDKKVAKESGLTGETFATHEYYNSYFTAILAA